MVLCCRKEQGFGNSSLTSNFKAANKFGALKETSCDIPEIAVEAMFDKIKSLEPDAIIWTGDVVPHDIWHQNLTHTIRYVKALTDKFYEFKDTPT
jgi:hypothetical protein